ncbi:MAG: DUF3667 domain-containing protein [Chitinophagaceae bacterium]
MSTNCKNCGTEITQKYCPNCGQAATLKRIDGHYIVHEIEHVLHFEKGILYTVRELVLRPGKNVRQFLSENRSRLVKPIIFIIITSLIYTIITHLFHVEEGYVNVSETKVNSTVLIFKWVQDHYGYGNIIMGVFIALWLKLFFRKHQYNFFEILILLCFVMGIGMLIFAVFALIQGLTHWNLVSIGGLVGFAYCAWAIAQFFDPSKVMSYVKSLFAYILGMLSFLLVGMGIGLLIDLVIKK